METRKMNVHVLPCTCMQIGLIHLGNEELYDTPFE